MRTKYNVKTVVVGGKPGTTQQYCGVVGGQSLNFASIDSDIKTAGLKSDALAPPDFIGDNYQGEYPYLYVVFRPIELLLL
jgi:hypothetical protein